VSYNPSTQSFSDVPDATISQTSYNNEPALKLTFNSKDNGPIDLDHKLGSIRNVVGLATTTTSDTLPNTGQNTNIIIAPATVLIIIGTVGLVVKKQVGGSF
jgi:LPXTG-motif cell wall-anchored protein